MRPSRWAVPPRVWYFHHRSARASDPSRQAQAVNGQMGRAPTDTGRPPDGSEGGAPVAGPFNTCINTVHDINTVHEGNRNGRRFGRGGAGACIGAATPRAAVCPTAFGCVVGLACRAPGHGGAVGA